MGVKLRLIHWPWWWKKQWSLIQASHWTDKPKKIRGLNLTRSNLRAFPYLWKRADNFFWAILEYSGSVRSSSLLQSGYWEKISWKIVFFFKGICKFLKYFLYKKVMIWILFDAMNRWNYILYELLYIIRNWRGCQFWKKSN